LAQRVDLGAQRGDLLGRRGGARVQRRQRGEKGERQARRSHRVHGRFLACMDDEPRAR
jgi:hypothetical protein